MSALSNSTPVILAILSYLLYALQASVLEQKLSGFSTGAIMATIYVLTLPLAFGRLAIMKMTGEKIAWPLGNGVTWWMVFGVIVIFFADYCMVAAYTRANALGTEYMAAIVGVGLLFPVFANVIKHLWTGSANVNAFHVAGYAVGVLSIVLVLVGSLREAHTGAAQPTPMAPVEAQEDSQ